MVTKGKHKQNFAADEQVLWGKERENRKVCTFSLVFHCLSFLAIHSFLAQSSHLAPKLSKRQLYTTSTKLVPLVLNPQFTSQMKRLPVHLDYEDFSRKCSLCKASLHLFRWWPSSHSLYTLLSLGLAWIPFISPIGKVESLASLHSKWSKTWPLLNSVMAFKGSQFTTHSHLNNNNIKIATLTYQGLQIHTSPQFSPPT